MWFWQRSWPVLVSAGCVGCLALAPGQQRQRLPVPDCSAQGWCLSCQVHSKFHLSCQFSQLIRPRGEDFGKNAITTIFPVMEPAWPARPTSLPRGRGRVPLRAEVPAWGRGCGRDSISHPCAGTLQLRGFSPGYFAVIFRQLFLLAVAGSGASSVSPRSGLTSWLLRGAAVDAQRV